MFQIDIDSQAVLTALARLQQTSSNMSPAMANIAQALASESERQFQTETGPRIVIGHPPIVDRFRAVFYLFQGVVTSKQGAM